MTIPINPRITLEKVYKKATVPYFFLRSVDLADNTDFYYLLKQRS